MIYYTGHNIDLLKITIRIQNNASFAYRKRFDYVKSMLWAWEKFSQTDFQKFDGAHVGFRGFEGADGAQRVFAAGVYLLLEELGLPVGGLLHW